MEQVKTKILTKRLVLRELTENDCDALCKVLGDPQIMEHYPRAFDENGVRDWIGRNIQRYKADDFGLWAVCLKDTGELIGDCGLTMQMIGGEMKPEIGYHIRKDHQRKGYAKEAACAVRDWAFQNTPFQTLYSSMKYTNLPSMKTAMAYGCQQVAEYPEEVNGITKVFAITKASWTQKRNAV